MLGHSFLRVFLQHYVVGRRASRSDQQGVHRAEVQQVDGDRQKLALQPKVGSAQGRSIQRMLKRREKRNTYCPLDRPVLEFDFSLLAGILHQLAVVDFCRFANPWFVHNAR